MKTVKTQANEGDVAAFLSSVEDPGRREDGQRLCALMATVTRREPILWGSSIIGFGSYHYVYASGREGDWLLTGFSPRKSNLVVYLMDGLAHHRELLEKLGPHKTGKSCLYLKRLEDVDEKVLKALIRKSIANMRKRYQTR